MKAYIRKDLFVDRTHIEALKEKCSGLGKSLRAVKGQILRLNQEKGSLEYEIARIEAELRKVKEEAERKGGASTLDKSEINSYEKELTRAREKLESWNLENTHRLASLTLEAENIERELEKLKEELSSYAEIEFSDVIKP
jgi:chromosome segregation ATPase